MQHLFRIRVMLSFGIELPLDNDINLLRQDTASLPIHFHLFKKEYKFKKICGL